MRMRISIPAKIIMSVTMMIDDDEKLDSDDDGEEKGDQKRI